jgi:hypothetical protein
MGQRFWLVGSTGLFTSASAVRCVSRAPHRSSRFRCGHQASGKSMRNEAIAVQELPAPRGSSTMPPQPRVAGAIGTNNDSWCASCHATTHHIHQPTSIFVLRTELLACWAGAYDAAKVSFAMLELALKNQAAAMAAQQQKAVSTTLLSLQIACATGFDHMVLTLWF